MTRNHLLLPILLFGVGVAPIRAQGRSQLPGAASDLVVQISAYAAGSTEHEDGAGILVAATNRVIVVTAAHVVRGAVDSGVVRAVFRFNQKDTVQLAIDHVDTDLDLAVLSVERKRIRASDFSFDRAGDSRVLQPGDPLYAVGCPDGECWETAVTPERFIASRQRELLFESYFISPGSSGGALFNRYGEVLGMVILKADPVGRAIPLEYVTDRLKQWGYTSQLKRRSVPRQGYATRLSVVGLASTTGALYQDGRWPSGRAALMLRGQRKIGWHIAALRLAPENLAVSGGLVGMDLRLQGGRFALTPFGEVGFGRVSGRFDAGGYYLQTPNGSTYRPFWNRQQNDVLGVGGGASLEILVFPHTALEGMFAHWSFQTPSRLRNLPDFFAGAGLRVVF